MTTKILENRPFCEYFHDFEEKFDDNEQQTTFYDILVVIL